MHTLKIQIFRRLIKTKTNISFTFIFKLLIKLFQILMKSENKRLVEIQFCFLKDYYKKIRVDLITCNNSRYNEKIYIVDEFEKVQIFKKNKNFNQQCF